MTPRGAGSAELQRRRAYDAVASALRTLAQRSPCCSLSTTSRTPGRPRSSCSATSPSGSGAPGCCSSAPSARRTPTRSAASATAPAVVRLGALPRSAVDALAAATGLGARGDRDGPHGRAHAQRRRVPARPRRGRPRGAGDPRRGRPGARRPPGPGVRDVLRAAAVLGRRLDPRQLATLGGWTELEVVRHCEELARVRLLVVSDRGYDFVNDLVQECVHASLPPALSAAYHRRAADLTADQPELMAEHAFAAGDADRAAHGWLLAGEAAMRRGAVDDAHGLFDRGVSAAEASSLRARLLIERARAHEASTAFAAALTDIDEALRLARAGPDRRLEMTALRARGGDVPVALRRPLGGDRRAPGGRARPRGGPRRPTGRGGVHHPAHHPGGEPAAAGARARPGGERAGAGAGRWVARRGRGGSRRPEDRPRLPRGRGAAARGRGRARARAPPARAHLDAAVDGVRRGVRGRRGERLGGCRGRGSRRR